MIEELKPVTLPPLLITAAIEPEGFQYFDARRQRYFPPERNHLPAHLTLFHRLPGAELTAISSTMKATLAERTTLLAEVYMVGMLGNAVVYRLRSAELTEIRRTLAEKFTPWLSRQDAANWQPHITVQNKVPLNEARKTLEKLIADFQPMTISITGLLLWAYLGGPWKLLSGDTFLAKYEAAGLAD